VFAFGPGAGSGSDFGSGVGFRIVVDVDAAADFGNDLGFCLWVGFALDAFFGFCIPFRVDVLVRIDDDVDLAAVILFLVFLGFPFVDIVGDDNDGRSFMFSNQRNIVDKNNYFTVYLRYG
jgi:hypothetical protein